MAKRLTEKAVAALGKKAKDFIVWDSQARWPRACRVTPRGRKVWVARLKHPGLKAAVQSGRWASTATPRSPPAFWGSADARAKAAEWYGWVKQGLDPEDVEREAVEAATTARRAEAAKRANTFRTYAERYIAGRNNKRAKTDAGEIRGMLVRAWGNTPVRDSARDVRELIDGIKVRAPYSARNAWGHTALASSSWRCTKN